MIPLWKIKLILMVITSLGPIAFTILFHKQQHMLGLSIILWLIWGGIWYSENGEIR